MNYRSIADLSHIIRSGLWRIPEDVDLVVGIPRSGLLAANIIALNLNLKVCDVESYISNCQLHHGTTRKARTPHIKFPAEAKHVLVVDDSIYTGESLSKIKAQMLSANLGAKMTFSACFATRNSMSLVDVSFDTVEPPRLFEWNLMHRPFLESCSVDIDGVLCRDPDEKENDDGALYREFIATAKPLVLPTYKVGYLITSRLEKYRVETEEWLRRHGVVYGALHMLDLPNAKARRELGCHSSFKAGVYKKLPDSRLFIESEAGQALEISKMSGKHCLAFGTQELYSPSVSYALLQDKGGRLIKRMTRRLVKNGRALL